MRLPCAFLAALVVVSTAAAQDWPVKPVRILVPFPPGGAADALPRIVGEKLSARFGQPFVIENRAGATGAIAGELLSRAEPDGYTFMSTPPAPLVINPFLYTKLPYDPTQFVPVTVMASIPSVLLVNPKIQAGNVQEFVAFARAESTNGYLSRTGRMSSQSANTWALSPWRSPSSSQTFGTGTVSSAVLTTRR